MSRLSRPNAFHGMLSWFSSSRLTMLLCKFCSRSLHAADPSYKLPRPQSKKIKQGRMGITFTVFTVVLSLLREVLPLETLPPHLQFGTLVYLETTNTCLSWLQLISGADFCLLFCYTIRSLHCHSLSILHVDPTPSAIISSRLVGGRITNSFAAQ